MLYCPLCSNEVEPYVRDRLREFHHCMQCDLVSVGPEWQLGAEAEKSYYDLHENDPADLGYRRFLSRLAAPLLDRLSPGMRGLDYGCGPGPTLSIMLEEAGMIMQNYDPIYRQNRCTLEQTYEFVSCTEVVEHFRQPAEDWALLRGLLRPGGWLGVMTKLVISKERFATWHYKDDPTHVAFYSPETFAWVGARFGLTVDRVDRDVVLMQKK